jgi:hypothetical protein
MVIGEDLGAKRACLPSPRPPIPSSRRSPWRLSFGRATLPRRGRVVLLSEEERQRLPLSGIEEVGLPGTVRSLYREARYFERAAPNYEAKILKTRAATIAGVIALLEHDHIDTDEIAVASLQEIERRVNGRALAHLSGVSADDGAETVRPDILVRDSPRRCRTGSWPRDPLCRFRLSLIAPPLPPVIRIVAR